jgi:hypothetical protein
MSKRERILAAGVAILVALFGLDRIVLQPLTDSLGQMQAEVQQLEAHLDDANLLTRNEALIEQRWRAYRLAGVADTADRARIRVQEQLTAWSQSAGLQLQSLSTGRVATGERFDQIGFTVAGTGSIKAVQRFMWSIRVAPFPLRISSSDIVCRDEQLDRLSLSLRLSTVAKNAADPVDGTPIEAWQPDEQDARQFRDIVAYSIFDPNRAALVAPVEVEPEPQVAVPQPTPADALATLVLVGVSQRGSNTYAFVEDRTSSKVTRIDGPGKLARGIITAILPHGITYRDGDETRTILVGQNLLGASFKNGTFNAQAPPADKPAASADSATSDIIRRLRQRRQNQE